MRCRPNEGPEGGWWLDRGKDNKLDLVHLGHECEEKLLGETPDEDGWIEAHLCLECEANIMGMASLNERLGLRPINQEAGEWPESDERAVPGLFHDERGPYDLPPDPLADDPYWVEPDVGEWND